MHCNCGLELLSLLLRRRVLPRSCFHYGILTSDSSWLGVYVRRFLDNELLCSVDNYLLRRAHFDIRIWLLQDRPVSLQNRKMDNEPNPPAQPELGVVEK